MYKKIGVDVKKEIFYDPLLSPLVGQWRLILNAGIDKRDKIPLREAFQEYIYFDLNYTVFVFVFVFVF